MVIGKATLKLTISPFATKGAEITARIEASNVPETFLELQAPDTVVISGARQQHLGSGTFKNDITWRVEHVQAGEKVSVQIVVSAGALFQAGLCIVR